VLAVGARYVIAGRHPEHARTMLRMGIGMAVVLAPAQLLIGDESGLDVAKYQPVKLAAIEAHWENDGPVPFVVFAIPNETEARNDYQIAIPYAGSLLITRTLDGQFPALTEFAEDDRPPLVLPFFAFRIMVAIGLAMIGLSFWGAWLWSRGRLQSSPLFLRLAALSWPFGFIAILSGWTVAEVGRQPWLATGILRTADSASPVPAEAVATTLVLFLIVYGVVFAAGILYMNRLINRGPADEEGPSVEGVPSRPISAAGGAGKQIFGEEGKGNA
ncbi:MAG: cytochrome ubiquinol oxidase subunit I, partial [Bauldia sp.]